MLVVRIRQDQRTNSILMEISQDLRYPSLVSATVGKDVFLTSHPKLQRCFWSLDEIALLCLQHGEGAFGRHCSASSYSREVSTLRTR